MKNFTTEQLISELGLAGEKIIINYLSEQRRIVKQSIDKFDSQKDITVDGNLTVEVKTQQPYVKMNALTFRPNQLRKCRNVNELYFVTAKAQISPSYKWNNCIFKVDPKNFVTKSYTTSYGVDMVAIPIEQEAVQFVKKLSEEEGRELAKYTQSNYKFGKRKY
mgnify:FL=1